MLLLINPHDHSLILSRACECYVDLRMATSTSVHMIRAWWSLWEEFDLWDRFHRRWRSEDFASMIVSDNQSIQSQIQLTGEREWCLRGHQKSPYEYQGEIYTMLMLLLIHSTISNRTHKRRWKVEQHTECLTTPTSQTRTNGRSWVHANVHINAHGNEHLFTWISSRRFLRLILDPVNTCWLILPIYRALERTLQQCPHLQRTLEPINVWIKLAIMGSWFHQATIGSRQQATSGDSDSN